LLEFKLKQSIEYDAKAVINEVGDFRREIQESVGVGEGL